MSRGVVSLNKHLSNTVGRTSNNNSRSGKTERQADEDGNTIATSHTRTSRRSTRTARSKTPDRGRRGRSKSSEAQPRRRSKSASGNIIRSVKRSLSLTSSLRRSRTSGSNDNNSDDADNTISSNTLEYYEKTPTRRSSTSTGRTKEYKDDLSFEAAVKRCIPSTFVLLSSQDELKQSQEDYYAMENYRLPSLPGRVKGTAGSAATCALLEMMHLDPYKFILPPSSSSQGEETTLVTCHELLKYLPKRIKQATKYAGAKPTISSSRPLGPPRRNNFAPFTLVPQGQTGVRRALLIGVITGGGHSSSSAEKLQGPPNDIAQMQHFLIKKAGFLPSNVTVLLEGSSYSKQPTKANILQAFDDLVCSSKPKDTCFIQYSGHGGRETYNVHICPSDFKKNGVIRDEDIMSHFIKAMPRGVHSTMLVDCCFSGSICDLPYILKSAAYAQEIEPWFDTDTRQEILQRERSDAYRGVRGGEPSYERSSSKGRGRMGRRGSGNTLNTALTLDTSVSEMSASMGGSRRSTRARETDASRRSRRPSTGRSRRGSDNGSTYTRTNTEDMDDSKMSRSSRMKSMGGKSRSGEMDNSRTSRKSTNGKSRSDDMDNSRTMSKTSRRKSMENSRSGDMHDSKTAPSNRKSIELVRIDDMDDSKTSKPTSRRKSIQRSLSLSSRKSLKKKNSMADDASAATTKSGSSKRRSIGRSFSFSSRKSTKNKIALTKNMNKSANSSNAKKVEVGDDASVATTKSSSKRRSVRRSLSWKSGGGSVHKRTSKTSPGLSNNYDNNPAEDDHDTQAKDVPKRRRSLSLKRTFSGGRNYRKTAPSKSDEDSGEDDIPLIAHEDEDDEGSPSRELSRSRSVTRSFSLTRPFSRKKDSGSPREKDPEDALDSKSDHTSRHSARKSAGRRRSRSIKRSFSLKRSLSRKRSNQCKGSDNSDYSEEENDDVPLLESEEKGPPQRSPSRERKISFSLNITKSFSKTRDSDREKADKKTIAEDVPSPRRRDSSQRIKAKKEASVEKEEKAHEERARKEAVERSRTEAIVARAAARRESVEISRREATAAQKTGMEKRRV